MYRLVNYSILTIIRHKSCTCIRSTPVETLHTILLGPSKYLLHNLLMSSLSAEDKKKLHAHLQVFPLSGIDEKVLGNLTRNYRSFVGRDFKALMQVVIIIMIMIFFRWQSCLGLSQ